MAWGYAAGWAVVVVLCHLDKYFVWAILFGEVQTNEEHDEYLGAQNGIKFALGGGGPALLQQGGKAPASVGLTSSNRV